MLEYESKAEHQGYRLVAGVDEAGRGPLAGPVVAAAVILPSGVGLEGLDDSKKLSPRMRDKFFHDIHQTARGIGVGIVSVAVIDEINILQASRRAMQQAVENLPDPPELLLIDGIHGVESALDQWTIIRGDSQSLSIAAASVVAKVTRDRLMQEVHLQYPQYEFQKHKGYGTRLHLERIKQYGPSPIHRRTFKGVREHL